MPDTTQRVTNFDSNKSRVYDYVWYKNPCKPDGLLTLWKKDRFRLVEDKRIDYATEAQKYKETFGKDQMFRLQIGQNLLHMFIFEDLAFKDKPRKICVTNTHLYWNPNFDDVKFFQMVIHWMAVVEFAGCHDANMDEKECED
jgi:CCR4-NOT transcription complex subunit 6